MNHELCVGSSTFEKIEQGLSQSFSARVNPSVNEGDFMLMVNHKDQDQTIVCEITRIEADGKRATYHFRRVSDEVRIRVKKEMLENFMTKLAESIFGQTKRADTDQDVSPSIIYETRSQEKN